MIIADWGLDMPNGDCPVGVRLTEKIARLEADMGDVKCVQSEQGKEQQALRLEQVKLAWSVGLILVVGSKVLNWLTEYVPQLLTGGG